MPETPLKTRYVIWTILIACWPMLLPAQSPKPDIVFMKNGDKLTGEVKRLEDGILVFKVGYAQTDLELDWRQVEHLESEQPYEIRLREGDATLAQIGAAANRKPDELAILRGTEASTVPMEEIVVVYPQKSSIARQLKGSAEVGFTMTKANSQRQISSSGSASYTGRRVDISLTGQSLLSTISSQTTANRHSFDSSYLLELPHRWFTAGMVEFLHSSEQQLQLRTTMGGGAGRHLLRSSRTRWDLIGGAVFTNENFTGVTEEEASANNAELLAAMRFRTYRFRGSEFNVNLSVYPSVSDSGRVRVSSNIYYKFKFYRDLYWKLSFVNNFDSRPPVNVPRNDYNLSTSFGWDF